MDMPVLDDESRPSRSIRSDSRAEAERFKWIESEKAGHDLGDAAIAEWLRSHWWGYLRARWIEHLQGETFWLELDRGDFGLLSREFQDHKPLLDTILQLLKDGWENLGVLDWATKNAIPIELVKDILEAIDINSCRLAHKFFESHAA